ncbi:MAG: hypothetical protein KDC84_09065 [Crocinitomicaceae bacterium]|nr:hypothetical protein [Crocinitomicaceae bacterium]
MKFFLLLFLIGLLYAESFACSCKGNLDPFYKDNLKKYYYFTGKVIVTEEIEGDFPKRKYTLLITNNFNSEFVKDTFVVYSSKGSCGLKLEIGTEYILGATKEKESRVGVCLLHARVEEKKELISKLSNK